MGVEETEGNRFGNFRSYPRSEILEMTIWWSSAKINQIELNYCEWWIIPMVWMRSKTDLFRFSQNGDQNDGESSDSLCLMFKGFCLAIHQFFCLLIGYGSRIIWPTHKYWQLFIDGASIALEVFRWIVWLGLTPGNFYIRFAVNHSSNNKMKISSHLSRGIYREIRDGYLVTSPNADLNNDRWAFKFLNLVDRLSVSLRWLLSPSTLRNHTSMVSKHSDQPCNSTHALLSFPLR
jgi:hypothetical protein